MGKSMREHLPFAMAWWHNLSAAGTDMKFEQENMGAPSLPSSGRQEYLQSILNSILFK